MPMNEGCDGLAVRNWARQGFNQRRFAGKAGSIASMEKATDAKSNAH